MIMKNVKMSELVIQKIGAILIKKIFMADYEKV